MQQYELFFNEIRGAIQMVKEGYEEYMNADKFSTKES